MTMSEFYAEYNLNKYDFASIAGVGKNTLVKFAEGKNIREDSKARIEKAMRVAVKYNLVRPKFDYVKGSFGGFATMRYKDEFHSKVYEYEEHFKELIKAES